ncbi:YfcC family protein [Photobacterium sanctipauli]|uniref:YfcC family protein n=2 Tax=Photobacterium sanctipauli TaxID=1342794 RepID=A0A2T3P1G3_9GAMM|nr:YfcC family protein [Photobacterium sanctipauli]
MPSQLSPGAESAPRKKKSMNPVIILLFVVLAAMLMTYFLDSGSFERDGKLIVPGTYQVLEKEVSVTNLFGFYSVDTEAKAVSLLDALVSIPQAINKQSGMIFMVLFIGGMFGVLNKVGAIETGLERMLSVTKGNVYLLVPAMMIVFSMGSTFMGMAKEYLLVIPMVVAMAHRMGLSNLIGLAIVAIPVKVGYLASITNPYALSIAQPLVDVPVFSGMGMRVMVYVVLMIVGILYVLHSIRKEVKNVMMEASWDASPLPKRHALVLLILGLGIGFLVYASQTWHWKYNELSAYYLALGVIFAVVGGLNTNETVDAFVSGMKKVLIAGVLIGLATSVSLLLAQGQVLDSIIFALSSVVGENNSTIAAYGMFFAQLVIDVAIPSTSGQAAVTMPILGPLGQLAGVDPHTTVLAFLMGNGATNIITPTSSGLLIFLATAQVGWGQWARYIFPFFLITVLFALLFLSISLSVYG